MAEGESSLTVAVSACLLGVGCRYDAGHRLNASLCSRLRGRSFIPVCPEVSGGLETPRPACAITGGDGKAVLEGRARVVTQSGADCTRAFVAGAQATLGLLKQMGVDTFYAKSKSPSCGAGQHSVFGTLEDGDGVTTALLRENGIRIVEVQS